MFISIITTTEMKILCIISCQ